MRIGGVIALGVVVFTGLASSPANACKCRESPEKERLAQAKWIFQGIVETSVSGGTEFTVRVTRTWRGPKVGDSVKVATSDSDCGVPLAKGYELILADSPSKDGVVGIELCGSSVVAIGKVREAELIKTLGAMKSDPPICACAKEMPQPEDAKKQAEIIFGATVVGREQGKRRWKLKVTRGFKAAPEVGSELVLAEDAIPCAFETVPGVEVIVAGSRNKDGTVTANPCLDGHILWTGPEIIAIGRLLDEAK